MKFFFDYERPELAAIFDPPFRATQIYKSVYQRSFDEFNAMTDLPKPFPDHGYCSRADPDGRYDAAPVRNLAHQVWISDEFTCALKRP